jgi:hypothetical protein
MLLTLPLGTKAIDSQQLGNSEQFSTKNTCHHLPFAGSFSIAINPPEAGASWYRRVVVAGG